jgi:hypothetical protein
MSDPIVAVAATKILELAFNEFIKTSAGETAKKLTGEALVKAGELRQKVVSWFQKKQDVKAEKAIKLIQEQGSLEALNKLTTYLDDEIEIERAFSHDLQQLARQIINIQNSNHEQVRFGEMKQSNSGNAKGTQVQASRIDRIGDDYTK